MELAGAYVDNELPAETSLQLLGHTRQCRDCREWIEGAARLKRAVRGAVRRLEVRADFRRDLKNALAG